MIQITLPLPPSANRLWRGAMKTSKRGKKVIGQILSEEAQKFYDQAKHSLYLNHKPPFPHIDGRIAATIELSGKTAGEYDIDNRVKAAMDALQKLGIIANDSQVDQITILRRNPGKGLARITLTQAEPLIDL